MSTVTHVGEESTRAKAVTLPDMGGKSSGRAIKDQAARIVMWSAFVIACVPLVWILVSTILKGGHMLASVDWWTLSQNGITARREVAAPRTPSRGR